MTAEIRINDALDPVVLGAKLQRERRLQIRDFLAPESAETGFRLIKDNRVWLPSYNEGEGNIELGLVPSFNTLDIFLLPESYTVQPVAPFARGTRTSITGWLQR